MSQARSVAFRVDSSIAMGTGHTMRCLALADAWRHCGHECHFLVRPHPGHQADLVRQRGHEVHCLTPPVSKVTPNEIGAPAYEHWLGARLADDASESNGVLKTLPVDWLIIDHYALDSRWERIQRPQVERILVIDDLADRDHDADLLLDQNLGLTEAHHGIHLPSTTRMMVGPMYALLRTEFSELRHASLARRPSKSLKHILVTLGGVDKNNATGKILDALDTSNLPCDATVTVVMGAHAPWLSDIQKRALRLRFRTHVIVNANNMGELMAQSDLAIGAAGSTAWERCCLGLPTLMVVLADNQRTAAVSLEKVGAAWPLELNESLANQLQSQIELLQANEHQALAIMSRQAATVTDGLGAARVLGVMQEMDSGSLQ